MRRDSRHRNGPDFLCIGAQKAGTTWLYENLKRHSQVWFPPMKELHYFDEMAAGIRTDLWARCTDRHWMNRWWRQRLLGSLRRDIAHGNIHDLIWHMKYFFLPKTMDRYTRLMKHPGELLAGDITPEYCALQQEMVNRIATHYPGIRIILILRNPIERHWSGMRMYVRRDKGKRESDCARLVDMEFAPNRDAYRLGCYAGMIHTWRREVADDRLRVVLYDQLKESPNTFLAMICSFLEIGRSTTDARGLVNAGASFKIPDDVRSFLVGLYGDELRKLGDVLPAEFHPYIRAWSD